MEDKEIIKGLAKKDKEAMATLYVNLQKPVLIELRKYRIKPMVKAEEADGIISDLIVQLVHRLESGKMVLKTACLTTYCTTACRNIWMKRQKKARRQDTFSLPESLTSDEELEQSIFGVSEDYLLRMAFAQLSKNCQAILGERYWAEDNKWNDVAEATGYSEKSIRHAGKRCKTQLQEIWAKLVKQNDVLLK